MSVVRAPAPASSVLLSTQSPRSRVLSRTLLYHNLVTYHHWFTFLLLRDKSVAYPTLSYEVLGQYNSSIRSRYDETPLILRDRKYYKKIRKSNFKIPEIA